MPNEPEKPEKRPVSRTIAALGSPDGASENEFAPGPSAPPVIASEALLAGRTEVHIRHRGETYRLTLTRTGKLILHK